MADQKDTGQAKPTPPSGEAGPSAGAKDAATEALSAAQSAINDIAREAGAAQGGSKTPSEFALPAFPDQALAGSPETIDLLADVSLNVKIELGRTTMLLEDVLKLGEGAVVELDKLAGDPVDIYVNNRPVARGEVLVMNDNFCVRVHEILSDSSQTRAAVARKAS